MNASINSEKIQTFLEGYDPMERIVNIECAYEDKEAYIIYRDSNDVKRIKKEPFFPFLWCKQRVARELFDGNRKKLISKMNEYGIGTKGLNIYDSEGKTTERLEFGYRIIFYAKFPMSYKKFMEFFTEGGRPLYSKGKNSTKNTDYLSVTPVEQFMISTGKRLFKGYDDYDNLKRFVFDLETTGLFGERDSINQIGVRTNKGMEQIFSVDGENDEEKEDKEKEGIDFFFNEIKNEKPDIITGHNIENFDIDFISKRLEHHGSSLEKKTEKLFRKPMYKKNKQNILKLGGEIEYYYPTVLWGHYITDSLHAVRRAQAIDSNMKKADLKYVTKYSNLDKPNRVYVPGNEIYKIWSDTENKYAFNDENGKWFKITESVLNKTFDDKIKYSLSDNLLTDNENGDKYSLTTGRYIVQRYLLDDLYEADKVELRYNQSNFLLGKLLPIPFNKVCTMGTAGIWKMIMLAWSYENDLAVPSFSSSSTFTGGLSRLLSVGYVDRIVKLDYNSLYPSIILTWKISTEEDITQVMLALLEYILTQREKFKSLKGKAGKAAKAKKKEIEQYNGNKEGLHKLQADLKSLESEESSNDKKQLPFKIFGNSFFGSFGAPNIFNWGNLNCAEKTTCIGRQSLRLMISWFTNRGYKPIVGDSFTPDTPLFVKYDKDGMIDIKPVCELIDEECVKKDVLGREYDDSQKDFKILCRSGWMHPNYIYRHETDKQIMSIIDEDKGSIVDVTEDHSLFNDKFEKIKPSEITEKTKLEYYSSDIHTNKISLNELKLNKYAKMINERRIDRIPKLILNSDYKTRKMFYTMIDEDKIIKSKTMIAGINFLKIHNKLAF